MRLEAARELLDRGWGKPVQQVEVVQERMTVWRLGEEGDDPPAAPVEHKA